MTTPETPTTPSLHGLGVQYTRAASMTHEEAQRRRVLALALLLGVEAWPVAAQQSGTPAVDGEAGCA